MATNINDRLEIVDRFAAGDRFFYMALGVSLLLHVSLIVYLSSEKIKVFQKPLKQIEVTYQKIEQEKLVRKKEEMKTIEAIEERDLPKKVEVLSKEPKDLPVFGEKIRDISKLSDYFRFSQKESPRIKTMDVSRNITVPMLQSEKISNPKYLSYNQHIRQKIKQQAYRHVDHPDFQQGEVYLTFVLEKSGFLQDLKVIDGRSHANNYLKMAGLRSIKDANPFPPFPKDLNYPQLTFNVVISFEVNE